MADFVQITINIGERDASRISKIGNQRWDRTTDEEKKEYSKLMALVGSAVCLKIQRGEYTPE